MNNNVETVEVTVPLTVQSRSEKEEKILMKKLLESFESRGVNVILTTTTSGHVNYITEED